MILVIVFIITVFVLVLLCLHSIKVCLVEWRRMDRLNFYFLDVFGFQQNRSRAATEVSI
jgi:uncharacterized membrane protein (Fun14 family)